MPAEFLYLDQTAVLEAGVLDMGRAMRVIGEALALYERGDCRQPHKVVLRDEEDPASEERGRFNGLFASFNGTRHMAGMKWIGSFPANRERGLPRASALMVLNSLDDGLPIALMDATLISAVRTGAVTGIGVHHLAPKCARKAGIIGAGVQARTQILGLFTALPQLEEIAVANRTREHAEELARECRERWGAPVTVARDASAALADADVALTVTTAREPLMYARYIKPGALTVQLSGHECEFDVVSQCSKIVVDNWDNIIHRGIITPAVMYQRGLLSEANIHATIGELVLKSKAGRESDDERIHLAHMGMGVCDVALGLEVYRTACANGMGHRLRLWDAPLWM
jgi:ornithine cyclodeaminase